jgi:hypothetical protein
MIEESWKMSTMRLIFLAGALGLLTACAGSGTKSSAEETAGAPAAGGVEARAKQRWDLMLAGKFAEAYDYFSPGYRAITPRDRYAASMVGRPVKWLSAEVRGKNCPADAGYCDVNVEVNYEMQSTLPGVGMLRSVGPVLERWIEIEGNWYFVPKEVTRNDRGLR